MPGDTPDRAQIQLTDAVLGFFTLAAFLAVSPLLQSAIAAATAEASGFTSVVFALMVPALLIALLLSLGVSARGGG